MSKGNAMSILKSAVGVALGLFLFLFVAMVGCAAIFASGPTTSGVCDKNGCSTQVAAVDAAKKHASTRTDFVFAGVCLDRGSDGWFAWSLTVTGCPADETFVAF